MNSVIILVFLFLLHTEGHTQESVPEVRLGVIADPQYADKDSRGSRFYRNSLSKLDTAVGFMNKEIVDFTVVLGDLVDVGIKDINPVKQRLATLRSPVHNLLGNHDFVDAPEVDRLYKDFGMPSPYYTVERGKWVFIFLNTNELSEYGTKQGTADREVWKKMNDQLKAEKRSNARPWNGGVGTTQLHWMEKQIRRAKQKSKDVLIFTHHPLFPENGLEALNNREILSILEKYSNVRAVISGHHHEGNFGIYKGIPMVTLEGMIETADRNSYGIIELYQHKLILKGYGRMTSRMFEF